MENKLEESGEPSENYVKPTETVAKELKCGMQYYGYVLGTQLWCCSINNFGDLCEAWHNSAILPVPQANLSRFSGTVGLYHIKRTGI